MQSSTTNGVSANRRVAFPRRRIGSRLLVTFAALIVPVSGALALQVAEPTTASANTPAMVKVPPIRWFPHRMHTIKKHRVHHHVRHHTVRPIQP